METGPDNAALLYRRVRGTCHIINTGAMFIAGFRLRFPVIYTDSYKFSIDWKAIA